jgi:hypothetical protein
MATALWGATAAFLHGLVVSEFNKERPMARMSVCVYPCISASVYPAMHRPINMSLSKVKKLHQCGVSANNANVNAFLHVLFFLSVCLYA